MFSKFLTLSSFLILTSGCSWWGGDASQNKIVTLDNLKVLGDSSNCIDRLGTAFERYFKGHSQERDVKETFSCVDDMSAKIFDYAEEQSIERGFSRKEIQTVLKSVFPKKDPDNLDAHVDLLFLVKRLLIGGDEDGFSREEKPKFSLALKAIEKEVLNARESIKYVFYEHEEELKIRNLNYAKLEKAFIGLDKVRLEFGGVLTSEEAISLVKHIFKDGVKISKYREIGLIAKDFLFGPGKSFVKAEKHFFERIFNAFEVQARLNSVDFSNGFLVGETFYDLQKALDLISGKLRLWSSKDGNYSLHVQKFKDLLAALHKVGVLRSSFSNIEMVNISLEKVLVRIFKTEVFRADSFRKFDVILKDWKGRQNRIISRYDFKWAKGRFDGLKKDSRDILKEIGSFQKPQFITRKDSPILIKRDDDPIVDTEEYFDFSLKHSLYTLVLEFFKSYSSKENLAEASGDISLSIEDLKGIFSDIRPLSLEMGFADPHVCGAINRSFIEADSLTMNGNGDYTLSINEAVEWMATMITVGNTSKHIFSKLSSKCFYPGMQMLGFNFSSRKCIAEEVFSKTRSLGHYFPSIIPYLDLLNSEGRRKEFEEKLATRLFAPKVEDSLVYSKLFTTAFNACGQEDFPYNRGELNTVVAVSIYLENVFYQFDKTGLKDWYWNDPEGADFILDGQEFSKFLNTKLRFQMDRVKKTYLDEWKVSGIADFAIKHLPESTPKLDRVSIYKLIRGLLNGPLKAEQHQYRKNYCADVYSSFNSSLTYKSEERLMCTEEETRSKPVTD